MSERVVVLGGGMGGLTAAHELAERGFDVDVYEKRERLGGKARSMPVPDTAGEDTKPLPGEHGFRFFPAFYRHLFDTMRRIPYEDNDEGVYGNLEPTTQWLIARDDTAEVSFPLELPEIIEDWETVLEFLVGSPFGVPEDERQFFLDRLLTFLTSCEERRREEYEHVSWWDFIDAEDKSEVYQEVYGVGVTRGLVAMRAKDSSTRTIGKIYTQLLFGIAMPWLDADSILDGPTNEVWIDPWVAYLEEQGVEFHTDHRVDHIDVSDGEIAGVDVTHDPASDSYGGDESASSVGVAPGSAVGGVSSAGSTSGDTAAGESKRVTGDYYVAALPVEVMSDLISDDLASAAPSLADVDELRTEWMNGIQYYLDTDVEVAHGHTIYQGAPWAITSISQQQFWESDLSEYGEADVEGILSICISNWDEPGEAIEKPAKECTPEEIKDEVLHQITTRLEDDASAGLTEENVLDWHLDPAIEYPAPNETTNAEPLLINTVGSLQYRPEADTAIPNLFLAADYVRTNSDLACMEGANEAARRSTNGILEASDSEAERCEVWNIEDPAVFDPMKAYDKMRYKMGLPHHGQDGSPLAGQ